MPRASLAMSRLSGKHVTITEEDRKEKDLMNLATWCEGMLHSAQKNVDERPRSRCFAQTAMVFCQDKADMLKLSSDFMPKK